MCKIASLILDLAVQPGDFFDLTSPSF